jgi:hypothetical protein
MSTLLGTVSETSSGTTTTPSENSNASQASEYPADKKEETKGALAEKEETK